MISGVLIGDKALVARYAAAPAAIKAEVDKTVQKWGFALQMRVQSNYLRGPRPQRLGVKTGRLLRSITQAGGDGRSRFVTTSTAATFYVGTNVEYAAGWEYGFSRRVGAGARGGPRGLMGKELDSYVRRHPPGTKQYAARPFLHPALSDIRQPFIDDLAAALKRGAQAAFK